MNHQPFSKTYKIKIPRSMYVQISATGLQLIILLTIFPKNKLWEFVFLGGFVIFMLVYFILLLNRILKRNNELELTEDKITVNQIELSSEDIEKIIIEGYFVESVGIKLRGKKLVKMNLHFRFKNDEERSVNELKQWAAANGIQVTNRKIYRWM